MKTQDLQSLIDSSSNTDVKFRLLNDFITELTDLDWHNIVLLFTKFDKGDKDKIFMLKLCIACMNMLYMNEKKYITMKQLTLIFKRIALVSELEVYELLKPFIDSSTMKIEVLLALLNSSNINRNEVKVKILKDFIVDLSDLDWNNIVLLLRNIDKNDTINTFKFCIVQMNNLYKDTKKYVTVEQIGLLLKRISSDKELEIYELLKPFIDSSTMNMEFLLALLGSSNIINKEVKFKILKEFIVNLVDLDWNNIVSLLENIGGDDTIFALQFCIIQMNNLYKDTKKYITVKQIGLLLKRVDSTKEVVIYELLKPFIDIPTNIQNLYKFIKFIIDDSQKIEYAKFSFDKIDLLSNEDLFSVLGSMQDDVSKVKFVELFADKIEISILNLFSVVKLIPTRKASIISLFTSKGLQLGPEFLYTTFL